MKTCPYCAEQVQDAALKCKHCGSDLTKRPAEKPSMPVATWIVVFVGLVGLGILLFRLAIGEWPDFSK